MYTIPLAKTGRNTEKKKKEESVPFSIILFYFCIKMFPDDSCEVSG